MDCSGHLSTIHSPWVPLTVEPAREANEVVQVTAFGGYNVNLPTVPSASSSAGLLLVWIRRESLMAD
jgi:hypothetical protein